MAPDFIKRLTRLVYNQFVIKSYDKMNIYFLYSLVLKNNCFLIVIFNQFLFTPEANDF